MKPVITRIVFLKDIIAYSASTLGNLKCLSQVHSSWYETIEEYSKDTWIRCFTGVNIVPISNVHVSCLIGARLENYGSVVDNGKGLSINGHDRLLAFVIQYHSEQIALRLLRHSISGRLEWGEIVRQALYPPMRQNLVEYMLRELPIEYFPSKTLGMICCEPLCSRSPEIIELCISKGFTFLNDNDKTTALFRVIKAYPVRVFKRLFNHGLIVSIDQLLYKSFSVSDFKASLFLLRRTTSLSSRFLSLKPIKETLRMIKSDKPKDVRKMGLELMYMFLEKGVIPTVDDIRDACQFGSFWLLSTLLEKISEKDRDEVLSVINTNRDKFDMNDKKVREFFEKC